MTFTVIQVFKLIAKLLDDRNNLMVLLNITELNLGDLLILLKMFKKTAVSLRELDVGPAEPLVSLLQSMVSTFDLATGKSMKLLWNHFRPTTLSTQGLFDVEQNILNVASSISYFTSDMTGKPLEHAHLSMENKKCTYIGMLYRNLRSKQHCLPYQQRSEGKCHRRSGDAVCDR
jgi:hypothetical protein